MWGKLPACHRGMKNQRFSERNDKLEAYPTLDQQPARCQRFAHVVRSSEECISRAVVTKRDANNNRQFIQPVCGESWCFVSRVVASHGKPQMRLSRQGRSKIAWAKAVIPYEVGIDSFNRVPSGPRLFYLRFRI